MISFRIDTLHHILKRATKDNQNVSDAPSPLTTVREKLKKLSKKWKNKFKEYSAWLAPKFIYQNVQHTEYNLRSRLMRAGFNIPFKPTRHVQRLMQLAINENTSLIQNIATQYQTRVNTIVTNGLMSGGKLSDITNELSQIKGISRRRAARIATDQNHKCNQAVERIRGLECGIKKGIWEHLGGGRNPRPDHEAADGRVYNLKRGCKISGEYIQPGQLPYCHCSVRYVIPGVDDDTTTGKKKLSLSDDNPHHDPKTGEFASSGGSSTDKDVEGHDEKIEDEFLKDYDKKVFDEPPLFSATKKQHILDNDRPKSTFQLVRDVIKNPSERIEKTTMPSRFVLRKYSGFSSAKQNVPINVVVERGVHPKARIITAFPSKKRPRGDIIKPVNEDDR